MRAAAWAGLQDSMPRSALLSLHARVDAIDTGVLEDPSLVQIWGPRYSAYVVAASDRAVFTLGRHPDDAAGRRRADDLAARIAQFLGGRSMSYADAGRALGERPNRLRYAATTGTVLIRWEGAGRPTIATVPPPDVDPQDARLELARRHLHVFGPTTPESFAAWAGIKPSAATGAFDALAGSLIAVSTPTGDAWILRADEEALLAGPARSEAVRLLPSGDTLYLFTSDEDRSLLVPDAARRRELWTSRVWPGAVLAHGAIVGTWRRSRNNVAIGLWEPIDDATRAAILGEAAGLPLRGDHDEIEVTWIG